MQSKQWRLLLNQTYLISNKHIYKVFSLSPHMFDENDVKRIFEESFKEFSKKHKITCSFELMEFKDFLDLAGKSNIIKKDIKSGFPVLVGALVVHSNKKDKVCMSVDVLNQLSDEEDFVKALLIHEFYHILLKSKVKCDRLDENLKSEERVKKSMKTEFPELSSWLKG